MLRTDLYLGREEMCSFVVILKHLTFCSRSRPFVHYLTTKTYTYTKTTNSLLKKEEKSCVRLSVFISICLSSEFLILFFFLPYLELILLVFGAFVKGPVISEPPDVIELVETFDVVRHSVSL